MSRTVFKTGKPHQERAAIWARRRLADKGGRCFSSREDQDGVLFADSVGLGKTWEALSAAALILCKKQPKSGRRHVLILCPSNLVTKWEDELSAGSPFYKRLENWKRRLQKTGQAIYARRVFETLSQVYPIRSAKHVQTKLKYGKFRPPGGTYIVSQSLFIRSGRGLNALRREDWDVVICDEAHNAAARKALQKLQERRRAETKLLLTATPFELEPHQLNRVTKNLVKRSHKVLNEPNVASYVQQLSEVFATPTSPGPARKSVTAASSVLKKLVARSIPRNANRQYKMLMLNGCEISLPERLDALDDSAVEKLLAECRQENHQVQDDDFELAYFEKRLRLATRSEPTFVATELRRFLASKESPRSRALATWAKGAFIEDLQRAIEDKGLPRKTLLFTSWVGDAKSGEATHLKDLLASAFESAFDAVKREYGRSWAKWKDNGQRRLLKEEGDADCPEVGKALRWLGADDLTCVLAGKHQQLPVRVAHELQQRSDAIQVARDQLAELSDRRSFEARSLRRRIRDMQSALSPWTTGAAIGAVERYTGRELRTTRDRVATAFREIGPPWVLVASNVGSEGIDLHTYTSRIIHYDLEWNPAKMEQREGRGDRVGRWLTDKLEILYCLVPRTYDERMFHQLVARDRWHGVLLGKPATQLSNEAADAPLIDRKRIVRMRLDLSP